MKTLFEEPDVWTVSQLTAQVKGLVENYFSAVWVTGEISSLTRASSGHIYLSLKDATALVRCVIWRTTASAAGLNMPKAWKFWSAAS